uniref:Secreted protein n=1 Tax=Heterorhabditis bacteriophora TaxID=37862 RepID=A0A1I7WP79_HETBA
MCYILRNIHIILQRRFSVVYKKTAYGTCFLFTGLMAVGLGRRTFAVNIDTGRWHNKHAPTDINGYNMEKQSAD